MSRRTVHCAGGSQTIPCPHNAWVHLSVIGSSDIDKYVCGKHFRSTTVAILRAIPGAIIAVKGV